jgi:Aldehyde dehydrogenase family
MPKTLSTTSDLLKRTLSNALDRDTFAVADKQIDAAKLSDRCIRLAGSPNAEATPFGGILTVPATRSIAIVDRYADMQQAASAILRARFSFGGQSPIAPQLVLVNEFRVKEFCNAIAGKTSQYFASQLEMNGGFDHSSAAKARATRTSAHELDQAGAETVISGSRGSVVRVNERKSSLLKKHINEPLLVIHPVTSLDDAIDFANDLSNDKPLAALHVFGSPDVGKYTSQFIHAHVSCINNIPVELLVAPLTPIGFPTQLSTPYRKEMFSIPSPKYIQFDEKSTRIAAVIDSNDVSEAAKLRKQAQMSNTKVKQPPGYALGHFEQGFFVGLSVLFSSIAVGSIVLWKYGVPAVMKLRG